MTGCYLHGFGDASKKAYCAVVYMVYQLTDGSRHVRLLTGKTRVAPLKQLTIPRLELMSATILTTLMETVQNALSPQVEVSGMTYWQDSKTALYWIRNAGEWKQFVRHRVNSILECTQKKDWRYCPTETNPADIGSRGATATVLKSDSLWWEGPPWLAGPESGWLPRLDEMERMLETQEEERKPVTTLVAKAVQWGSIANVVDLSRHCRFQLKIYPTFFASSAAYDNERRSVLGVVCRKPARKIAKRSGAQRGAQVTRGSQQTRVVLTKIHRKCLVHQVEKWLRFLSVRLSRPVQKLYPIEVRSEEDARPVSSRETLTPEKGAGRNVPKRAAALDAAWRTRAILDS